MFFSADDDENDFLTPSGGSKLAGLFGMPSSANGNENESLTYTAPKQPKKKEASPAQQGAAAPVVTYATAVHAYKYVDNQHTSQGKVGAAILSTHSTLDYKILLYVSKQQQVTNAKITPSFAFSIQANNYGSFYDDARQSWSVMFEKSETGMEFAKQVALAKANSAGPSLNAVVSQDTLLGEGGALEVGDSAEVKYTGWLLTNNTLGQVFDSNVEADKLFRFKVGKGKVIKGWDEGMLGMLKNGRRILIIPPSLAYGAQGAGSRVPPNSTLVFDVQVVRVKLAKEKDNPSAQSSSPAGSANESTPVKVPVVATQASTDSTGKLTPDDDGVKARSKSINEQLSQSPTSGKAKLISRMAKMGKPMLPFSGSVPSHPDSSEDEEHVQQSPEPVDPEPVMHSAPPAGNPGKPKIAHKPHVEHPVATQPMNVQQPAYPMMQQQQQQQPQMPMQSMPPPASQVAVYQPMQQFQQPFQQVNPMYGYQQQQVQQQQQPPQYGGMFPQQQQFPGQPVAPPMSQSSDTLTTVLLSESRQQNTELRLSLGKVSDKIDKVQEKLDHLQLHGAGTSSMALQTNTPTLETGVLLQNIQRIIQENERVKRDVFEKSTRIESQNEKIAELLQRNQQFVEQSNTMLEQRNDTFKSTAAQSQARVLILEQEKIQMATEYSAATSQLSTLQLEIAELKKRDGDLQQKLHNLVGDSRTTKDELATAKSSLIESEKKVEEITSSLREEKQKRKQAESQLSTLEEELAELKSSSETLDKSLQERKKKHAGEKRKLEDEIEELKQQHESEVQDLKDKLRKQKTSTDAVAAEQVSKIEEELTAEWKSKCDRLLATSDEKHQRIVRDLQEEKDQLSSRVQELTGKISEMRSSQGGSSQQIKELEEELSEMKLWKDKYDSLRTQAGSMKQKYETRIRELIEQRDEAVERVEQVPSGGGEVSPDVIEAEVKKVMNKVFQTLRAQFQASESYTGQQVLTAMLNTIKMVTLKLVTKGKDDVDDEEDEEEEEEEVEEDLEEHDDDEDDDESEDGVGVKENAIEPSKAHITGDKGVPIGSVEDVIEPSKAYITGDKGVPIASSEETIKPSKAYITGDKGVPIASTEDTIVPSKAYVTGDKGVPMASNEDTIEPSKAYITGDKGVPMASDEDMIEPSKAYITGDKGVPMASNEDTVEPSKAYITGDKGVPLVSAEDTIEPSTAYITGDRGVPMASNEGTIDPTKAHITGDKGVPMAASEDEIMPSKAFITGDRGVPLAANEDEITPSKGLITGDKGFPMDSSEDAIIPSKAYITGDKGVPLAESEDKIQPSVAHITGDKGVTAESKTTEKKPSPKQKQSNPLFGDDDDMPLFGADTTVEDTFGADFLKTKKKPVDDDDDDLKEKPPPPLFGDEDDDDDLDWLS